MNDNNEKIVPDGEYSKRGYLKENYRIFKINDRADKKFDFHYHEFDKIVFFLSGNVKYIIEGKEYVLKPYDILLVRHGDIHKPVIDSSVNYDRVIIWVNKNYLNRRYDLSHCFEISKKNKINLMRIDGSEKHRVFTLLEELSFESKDLFADDYYKDSVFIQLMILLNRSEHCLQNAADYKSDKQIDKVIAYIDNHLFDNLTVDKIANELFISRYHLMHKFKNVTGESVHSYISKKRLFYAADLLKSGKSAKYACFESGYNDYSVFLKAFKNEFKVTPVEYKKLYFK